MPSRLLAPNFLAANFESSNTGQPESLLHPISLLRERNGVEFREGWQRLADSVQIHESSKQERVESDAANGIAWNFADPESVTAWNLIGAGLKDQPSPPGVFAIASEGDSALSGIYPAGIYSHLISDKQAARLTSQDVNLSGDWELWLRVIGDGESSTRYVVQDYPRNGTVYPVKQLTPKWTWQRFDLSYWKGDLVNFEIVTSKDAPLLVHAPQRSWFGVSEVRLLKKGSSPPDASSACLVALVEATDESGLPQSIEDLAALYQSAIGNAIRAWAAGQATNTEAELLSACLDSGMLTNSLQELSAAAPMIQAYRELEAEIQAPTRVPSLDETSGRTQPLYVRGNHRKPGEIVPRRFLEAIDASEYRNENSGREQLAEDLLGDDNPLTRRVIVNRIWHHLFGRGIVGTPDNLGRMGQEPTHPELLDWLACRLVQEGWSLKSLIRQIVTSQTWQQSSLPSKRSTQLDPSNLLLSHANLKRLEAEAIRDSLLSASGHLDRTLFGPPVAGDTNRRSVYVRVIRNSLDPFLRAFDFPEPFSATGRRDVTNVPAQSLTLMNDPMVTRWATQLADSMVSGESDPKHGTDRAKLQQLFMTLLSRPPTERETTQALAYLQTTRGALQSDAQHQDQRSRQLAVWTEMSRALLLLKEVIYVP